MGGLNKNKIKTKGKVEELPFYVRKKMYDLITSIDLEEADRLRAKGKFGIYKSEEEPGIGIIVYDEKIVMLMRTGVYDLENQSMADEDVFVSVGISRNKIEDLVKEN